MGLPRLTIMQFVHEHVQIQFECAYLDRRLHNLCTFLYGLGLRGSYAIILFLPAQYRDTTVTMSHKTYRIILYARSGA